MGCNAITPAHLRGPLQAHRAERPPYPCTGLTFAVTALQHRGVFPDQGGQSPDVSIRRCLGNQVQADFLRRVTFVNQTETHVCAEKSLKSWYPERHPHQ